jgi:hypothetical protein
MLGGIRADLTGVSKLDGESKKTEQSVLSVPCPTRRQQLGPGPRGHRSGRDVPRCHQNTIVVVPRRIVADTSPRQSGL